MSEQWKTEADKIDQRIAASRAEFDTERLKIRHGLLALHYDSSLRKIKNDRVFNIIDDSLKRKIENDRDFYNSIIDPIVDSLRKSHGKNCDAYANLASIRGNKPLTQFVFNFDLAGQYGIYRMVPNPEVDGGAYEDYRDRLHLLLENKLEEVGKKTDAEKADVKREILRNRYYEVNGNDMENHLRILALILVEAMRGYNAIEPQLMYKCRDSIFENKEDSEVSENSSDSEE
ncbi:predicted protein [Chaetoceros tenuissimus]|uniref:Uncharacterized protein n=1 Tax=Chaetoceros tenuissimus TaxID=426638 RepID=A0AAD3H8P8_9STRA|nr:predicted protein [Chaetoceros tenuissimus]